MGRGGSSGGGSSGGSGRSSSSHSSSSRGFSSRSHTSSSSSRGGSSGRGGSSPSGFGRSPSPGGPRTPPPPHHHHGSPHRPMMPPPFRRYYGRPRRYGTYYDAEYEPHRSNWLSGFILFFTCTIFICTIFILVFARAIIPKQGNLTVSTVNREPLSGVCVESGDWYEDSAGWISSKAKVTSGMKTFYKKTGVQPYLIITDEVNGKGATLTDTEAEAYLEEKYDSLFNDEGHLIFLFMEYADSKYKEFLYVGNKAASVIDLEAQEIIYDYADYYYTSDLDDDTYFSMVFEKAADRIMTKTTTNKDIAWKIVGVIGAIGGIIIIGIIVIKRKKYEAQRAEEDRRILETPVNTPEDDSLKNKYQ